MAKVTLVGVRLIAGATPVPVKATLCGLPPALSVMLKLAVLLPVIAGEKVTFTVLVAFGATVIGVVAAVKANWAASLPVTARFEITRSAEPVFLIMTGVAALVVPCS